VATGRGPVLVLLDAVATPKLVLATTELSCFRESAKQVAVCWKESDAMR
jgi:hypothetical protein